MNTAAQLTSLVTTLRGLALLRQTLEAAPAARVRPIHDQVLRVTSLTQRAMEELVRGQQALDAAIIATAAVRQQQRELFEALGPCVVTGAGGVILEANTAALLMLRASAQRFGEQRIQEFAPDAEALVMGLDQGSAPVRAALGLRAGRRSQAVDTQVTRVAGDVPRWQWLFRRGAAALASAIESGV